MQKVQISCYGRQILVDEDQVKLHVKKWSLVQLARQLSDSAQTHTDINAVMTKIIRLNRRIRQNVQFVK